MDNLMKIIGGNASGNMIHKTGGIEHLQKISPQAGPAPEIPCPPAPCPPVNPNAPLGPAVAVHEPAAGQRVDIEVVPNQPLIFDFNPLDLQATRADNTVTLTFPDGAQVVLHDIVGPCGPQPTPFQLPDGTIITPSELLHTFNLGDFGPCFTAINPTAGPTPIGNTGFYYAPFEVGEIGPGVNGLGPLGPTGFGYGAEFLKGAGGSPTTPGGPTPPGPPGTFLAVSEDVQNTVYPALPITGDYFTDTNYVTGQPVVSSSPAPFITSYVDPDTGSTTGVGRFGDLTLNTATGVYSYNLTPAGDALASQLGSDQLSANISHIPNTSPNTTGYSLVDNYTVTTSNGFETGTSQLLLRTYGVDAHASTANTVTETVGPGTAPEVLLTYTDAADPAHSFQQLATINASGVVTFAAGSDTFVQPNDPALVTLEIVPGSGTASVTVTGVTIEGQTATFAPVIINDNGTHQALSLIVNPNLGATGTGQDPGDTGNASSALGSEHTTAAIATLSSTAVYTDPLSGLTETYGYLYDNTAGGAVVSMGGGTIATADTLNFDGTPGTTSTTITGSGAAGASNVIDWSSATNLTDGIPLLSINGGTGGGLNTLGIETAAAQNLDFRAVGGDLTTGAGGNVQNIQVFDLSDGAHPSATNSITLTPDAVFNLAGNEPGIISSIGGGALAVWVLGTAADTVNLSGSWTPISGAVVSGSPQTATLGPGAGNFGAAAGTSTQTQMVGFAEFAGTTTGGQTVHVYVENAIAQAAGHVHHT